MHILCLHLRLLHPSEAFYCGHPLPVNAISLIQLSMENDASESTSKESLQPWDNTRHKCLSVKPHCLTECSPEESVIVGTVVLIL